MFNKNIIDRLLYLKRVYDRDFRLMRKRFVTVVLISIVTLVLGGSTACVVALHKAERIIYTANLGDSGFMLIRNGEVVHRSEEQQHYFNTPFQLTVAPPEQEGLVLSDR